MVDDPMLQILANRRVSNFCGCNATGDEKEDSQVQPDGSSIPVNQLQAWRYIRMGLVIVGAFVVGSFIYKKLLKS